MIVCERRSDGLYVRCQRSQPLTIILNLCECKVQNISKKNSAFTVPKGRFTKEAGVLEVGSGANAVIT